MTMLDNLTKNFFALMSFQWPRALASCLVLAFLNLGPFAGIWFAHGWQRLGYTIALFSMFSIYVGMSRKSDIPPYYFVLHPVSTALFVYTMLRSTFLPRTRRRRVERNVLSPGGVEEGHGVAPASRPPLVNIFVVRLRRRTLPGFARPSGRWDASATCEKTRQSSIFSVDGTVDSGSVWAGSVASTSDSGRVLVVVTFSLTTGSSVTGSAGPVASRRSSMLARAGGGLQPGES